MRLYYTGKIILSTPFCISDKVLGILFDFGNFTAAVLQCATVAFGGELGAFTRARCRVEAVDGIALGYYAYRGIVSAMPCRLLAFWGYFVCLG